MKRSYGLVFFAFALALWATTASASAQATRTWVSGVGDDANPCSRTAPCKTWAGAISKTAAGGEMDALDPGGFGALTITKAITIDGGGGQVASVLVTGTPGITINAGTTDVVTLRNLSFNGIQAGGAGGTTGIVFMAGLTLNVEHCFIQNFTQYGIQFQPTVASHLNVMDSIFENNTLGGLISSTSASGTVNHVSIIDSDFTYALNGFGVESGTNSTIQIYRGLIAANHTGGIISTGAGAVVDIDQVNVTNNGTAGLHATASGIVRMTGSSITTNTGTGLLADGGGQILSWSNNHVAGNATDGAPTSTIPNI